VTILKVTSANMEFCVTRTLNLNWQSFGEHRIAGQMHWSHSRARREREPDCAGYLMCSFQVRCFHGVVLPSWSLVPLFFALTCTFV
jgi:hypothetical protein